MDDEEFAAKVREGMLDNQRASLRNMLNFLFTPANYDLLTNTYTVTAEVVDQLKKDVS